MLTDIYADHELLDSMVRKAFQEEEEDPDSDGIGGMTRLRRPSSLKDLSTVHEKRRISVASLPGFGAVSRRLSGGMMARLTRSHSTGHVGESITPMQPNIMETDSDSSDDSKESDSSSGAASSRTSSVVAISKKPEGFGLEAAVAGSDKEESDFESVLPVADSDKRKQLTIQDTASASNGSRIDSKTEVPKAPTAWA
jgi:hypothetical protein